VVHGLLHLAGYDDHDPREARRMHRRARRILGGRSGRVVPSRLWAGLLEV
jgi:ssRNA-specific RNase YbeY (16S rRNA maturation enzyme)